MYKRILSSAAVLFSLLAGRAALQGEEVRELLPDLIVEPTFLRDHDFFRGIEPGRLHLRLSNGTANVGEGPLYLYGVAPERGSRSQEVRQRIFRTDRSYYDTAAGQFIFHPGHSHVHVQNWAIYRLREMLPGDGIGPVVAEGGKTSFCILDLDVHNPRLANFQRNARFTVCDSTVQGLSVGWIDVYEKMVPEQNIDVTDVPDGLYWLESEVDPDGLFLESNEENNIARTVVIIGKPTETLPDRYEPNDLLSDVDARVLGAPNSANLGPTGPSMVIDGLSIDHPADVDVFRFYSNHAGRLRDFVRVEPQNRLGRLDMELLDSAGNHVRKAVNNRARSEMRLNDLPEGWYYVRIFAAAATITPRYSLGVNPPSNRPPTITVNTPPEGNVEVVHGLQTYMVEWSQSDPENDLTWVSVYINTRPVRDGTEELIRTTLHTPGEQQFAVINTAAVEPGTYWVYGEIKDGGRKAGSWSAGTLSVIELPGDCVTGQYPGEDCDANGVVDNCDLDLGISPDCNQNGIPDLCEIQSGRATDRDGNGVPDGCERTPFHRGDADGSGSLDINDGVYILRFLFAGGPPPSCMETSDVDNNARLEVTDGVAVLLFLFQGGQPPVDPGPPGSPCGTDTDPEASEGDFGCQAYGGCS